MAVSWVAWVGFLIFITAMLALDLGVLQRRAHAPTFRQSLFWSCVWIGLALVFAAGVWYWYGAGSATQFLTGYVIEKALSIDNLFVFVVIFSWFSVPNEQQHRLLFWGVLGALCLRGIFIAGGVLLIHKFAWITWAFGGLLLYTGYKMFTSEHSGFGGESNLFLRVARRVLPISSSYDGQRLVTRRAGVWQVTPLLLALLVIEMSDVMFAVDSIPAIFAVTTDPFIVFTSNVFAILGLRALYFLLVGFLDRLHYLKYGLAAILLFVGLKMVFAHWVHISSLLSLGIILCILTAAALASLISQKRKTARQETVPSPPQS